MLFTAADVPDDLAGLDGIVLGRAARVTRPAAGIDRPALDALLTAHRWA